MYVGIGLVYLGYLILRLSATLGTQNNKFVRVSECQNKGVYHDVNKLQTVLFAPYTEKPISLFPSLYLCCRIVSRIAEGDAPPAPPATEAWWHGRRHGGSVATAGDGGVPRRRCSAVAARPPAAWLRGSAARRRSADTSPGSRRVDARIDSEHREGMSPPRTRSRRAAAPLLGRRAKGAGRGAAGGGVAAWCVVIAAAPFLPRGESGTNNNFCGTSEWNSAGRARPRER